MALGNKNNVIVGAASIYLGDFGAALPALTGGYRTAMDGSAAWRNVGYTQDGLEISTDPSYGEVEVDQLLDAAVIFKDGMGLSVSTTFAEATLENLLVAWGQAQSTLTSTASEKTLSLNGGTLGQAPLERALVAVGNAPKPVAGGGVNNYSERLYHVYRVLSVESTAISLARADASTIPVTFRALPDDNGEYGVVRDKLS
jgi:hypothetical protein